ncbi:MAG: Hsp20/alpha crystallin family protein, partial [Patescibacteria group bacterium]|nr:Hsp20/alpha crystallin family protein [Patescibacteria group bacterium]
MFSYPFRYMDNIFNGALSPIRQGFTPAVDVYQTKDAVIVETPLAGVDPKDVEITVENDVLTIRGEMKKESEVEDKDYYRKEVRAGSFYRSVALPTRVVSDKASAESHEGMLKITIPKAAEVKPKTVKIVAKKKK